MNCIRAAMASAFTALLSISCEATAATYKANEALAHIGEDATVCGVVASAKYASSSKGKPTFLNLDRPYPNHVFTAVIWGEDRDDFPYVPESLDGKRICVNGTIKPYKGRAEIIVDDPDQISRK
jgi:DNA/RNA endonuclease YhcR with UshA esterase domain